MEDVTAVEALRIVTVAAGVIALLLTGSHLFSYHKLMTKFHHWSIAAIVLYQLGSVYGSTEALLKGTGFRFSILFTLAGHLIVCTVAYKVSRVVRSYYGDSFIKKATQGYGQVK